MDSPESTGDKGEVYELEMHIGLALFLPQANALLCPSAGRSWTIDHRYQTSCHSIRASSGFGRP